MYLVSLMLVVASILDIAEIKYGETFANYLESNYTPFDVLYDLADLYSVVLLNGDGFASSKWSVRVSLANLQDDAYVKIGQAIRNLIDTLYKGYNLK